MEVAVVPTVVARGGIAVVEWGRIKAVARACIVDVARECIVVAVEARIVEFAGVDASTSCSSAV